MRIGIDVGGTNTDAVAIEGGRVLKAVKTPTTKDVGDGIRKALAELLDGLDRSAVTAVMLGTTHFANAVVERRRLTPTAAVRLCLPAGASLPPMCDWPRDLREIVDAGVYLTTGGLEFDGRPIAELDEAHLRRIGRELRERGVEAVAVSAVFSPLNAEMEEQAAAILRDELPGAVITRSTEIGRMGLLERENAAILNASLVRLAREIVAAFKRALADLGLDAPFYITQNDGTLVRAEVAAETPVVTFSSGPTNSMRGAAFLTGETDAVVVDIGGTTSDVGVLVRGFPRPAAATVEVGGVRTNFRMPDVYSLGLGGGSIVQWEPFAVGPKSVGYELTRKARVFGGDVWTATDLAVAAGYADVGDPSRLPPVERSKVEAAVERMHVMLEEAIDRMKTSADPVPAIVVGGGSILVRRPLAGTSRTLKPEHFAVANAIGAAIAQVGGEVDRIVSYEGGRRKQVLEALQEEAVARAVEAGADPRTVQVVDLEEVPLAYLPGDAARVRVKAVGDLDERAAAAGREGLSGRAAGGPGAAAAKKEARDR
ncbi:MAG: hydantoinase/oxoprolinase family protein [Clostridia bacterium]|nr:hydantoinase/oxoprolinase family protein [Clostridia bacterium]